MKTLFFTFIVILASVNANAAAQINARDSEGNEYVVGLDTKDKPRTNSSAHLYPTIKDFRQGGENGFYCVEGSDEDVRKLLTRLVGSANGDGDSWAELKAIYKNSLSWVVLAEITDESGKGVERYSFPNCR